MRSRSRNACLFSKAPIYGYFLLLSILLHPHFAVAQPRHYRGNPGGLEDQVRALVDAARKGDQAPFRALAIPDASSWFRQMLGEVPGAALAAKYEEGRAEFETVLPALIRQAAETRKDIQIRHDDELVRDPFFLALRAVMRQPDKVLAVVLNPRDDKSRFHLGYFVYLDGFFRYVGWLFVVTPNHENELFLARPGIKLQYPEILQKPRPRYPQAAKSAGIQGTVRLAANVTSSGKLKDVRVVSGHPFLVEAVTGVVSGWQFKPLAVEGKPIETPVLLEFTFTIQS